MQVRFDWFDVPAEKTIADICRQKAVNLVSRFRERKSKDINKDFYF
jgi:hypothetical protein